MIFPEDEPSAPARTRVKICGLTHPEDAALAVALGADALGLNFYPRSPRCLDAARDAAWLRALPRSVCRIAVVVNASHDDIARLLGEGLVDAVQLHGDEDETFCRVLQEAGTPFIKALRARDETVLERPERFGTPFLLVDAFHPAAYGGTGQAVDWSLAARFAARHRRTFLAGGLHPGNVAAAVHAVRPYGIDVASGVEGEKGARRKDAKKLEEFFAAVRSVDAADLQK